MADIRKELVSHAYFIGPKYLGISSGVCVFLVWAASFPPRSGVDFLLLLIGVAPMAAIVGAAAGVAFCPAAQWIVGALHIRKEL